MAGVDGSCGRRPLRAVGTPDSAWRGQPTPHVVRAASFFTEVPPAAGRPQQLDDRVQLRALLGLRGCELSYGWR